MARRSGLALFLAVAALLNPVSGWAEAPDPTASTQLFDEGVALYNQGQYAQALDRFQRAHASLQNPKILLNMGQAQLKLGHLADAAQLFQQFINTAPASPDAAQAELVRFARQKVVELEPQPNQPEPTGGRGGVG